VTQREPGRGERCGRAPSVPSRPAGPESHLLRALAYRDLSVSEARARLVQKGLSPEQVEAVIGWGRRRGYLDDARLVRDVADRAMGKEPPPSADRLRELLERRGFAAEVQAAEVARACGSPGELSQRLASYVASCDLKGARRQTIFARLLRAGHAPEAAEAAFDACGLAPGGDDCAEA
jgi:SOS response regulatory protein OraA/RecX